ncbi:MAG TPA: energy transducer TonB [Ferruginibacter sp.]|nr:energy transducer TonB [Ferruginibacter sp.]
MEANKILNADLLDIIFDGKNKSYGAYDLRKSYASRLKKALAATFIALAVILLGSVLANKVTNSSDEKIDVIDTQMAEIKKDEVVVVPPPPPPPVKPPPPPEINQVKFTPPKVVKDEEVKPEEKIEEIKEDAAISTKTVETENKVQIVQAPVEDKGTVVAEAPKIDYESTVFNKVEIEAEYPGGSAAWAKYLRNNLDANTPVDNGASEGTYTVVVRFIVSKDGSISDVVAETKHGYGMEAEAMKIIKKGPKWTPAQQNGRMVNAYRRQPITFVVQEQ